MANAYDFLNDKEMFPQGYETEVGDGGD